MPALHRPLATTLLVIALLSVGCPAPPSGAVVGRAAEPAGAWPLSPRHEVARGFDPPSVAWAAGHRGVDLLGSPGQAVHAALGGTVTFAGMLAGRGVVVVDHGETRTTYEPVTATVAVGAVVPRGGVIGSLATVASHCLPQACLHWGWLRGGTYLDPLGLVGAGQVRLLPLWGDEAVRPRAPPAVLSAAPWAGPYVEALAWLADLARGLSGARMGLLVGTP